MSDYWYAPKNRNGVTQKRKGWENLPAGFRTILEPEIAVDEDGNFIYDENGEFVLWDLPRQEEEMRLNQARIKARIIKEREDRAAAHHALYGHETEEQRTKREAAEARARHHQAWADWWDGKTDWWGNKIDKPKKGVKSRSSRSSNPKSKRSCEKRHMVWSRKSKGRKGSCRRHPRM